MIIRTEYKASIKWETGADIYDDEANRYITTLRGSKEAVNEFLKKHFTGEFFPCRVRIEFDGITAYKFEQV